MNEWTIKVLYYGRTLTPKSAATFNLDADKKFWLPYLGFLLQRDGENILVDTGISENFIVDGKAWGGNPAEGGREFALKALDKENLKPSDISTIIYTHLHNDHAASHDLFKNARIIVQRDEWANLLDPLPVQRIRKDYDLGLIGKLSERELIKIDGDIEFLDGIRLFKTPGHTRGSQSVAVTTKKGVVVLVGDLFLLNCNVWPSQDTLTDMEGQSHAITPGAEIYGPAIPSSIVYDYYDWYDSVFKVKAIASQDKPGFIIPGHEPSLIYAGI